MEEKIMLNPEERDYREEILAIIRGDYTDEQIKALTEYQEQWFESIIIRK